MLNQQGDVLMFRVDEIPKDAKKLNHLVIMEGELTGHAHRVSEGIAYLFEHGSTKYIQVVSEKAVVTHEEHHAQTLDKGSYRINQVKEYDHFLEESRAVID